MLHTPTSRAGADITVQYGTIHVKSPLSRSPWVLPPTIIKATAKD